MTLGEYELKNEQKAQDAFASAHVINDHELSTEEVSAVIAEYDKRAGLIHKDGVAVPTGTFWDFENKAPKVAKKAKKETVEDGDNFSDVDEIVAEKEEKKAKKATKSK